MLALSLSVKFYCFGIFVFVLNRFLFSRFSFVLVFIIFFVLVLVFVNEFVIFSFFTIFVFVFVNENHTGTCPLEFANARKFCRPNVRWLLLLDDFVTTNFGTRAPRARAPWNKILATPLFMRVHSDFHRHFIRCACFIVQICERFS